MEFLDVFGLQCQSRAHHAHHAHYAQRGPEAAWPCRPHQGGLCRDPQVGLRSESWRNGWTMVRYFHGKRPNKNKWLKKFAVLLKLITDLLMFLFSRWMFLNASLWSFATVEEYIQQFIFPDLVAERPEEMSVGLACFHHLGLCSTVRAQAKWSCGRSHNTWFCTEKAECD